MPAEGCDDIRRVALAPPMAGLADDINDLTDPINAARGAEQ
jgi:hypothetical protein